MSEPSKEDLRKSLSRYDVTLAENKDSILINKVWKAVARRLNIPDVTGMVTVYTHVTTYIIFNILQPFVFIENVITKLKLLSFYLKYYFSGTGQSSQEDPT